MTNRVKNVAVLKLLEVLHRAMTYKSYSRLCWWATVRLVVHFLSEAIHKSILYCNTLHISSSACGWVDYLRCYLSSRTVLTGLLVVWTGTLPKFVIYHHSENFNKSPRLVQSTRYVHLSICYVTANIYIGHWDTVKTVFICPVNKLYTALLLHLG